MKPLHSLAETYGCEPVWPKDEGVSLVCRRTSVLLLSFYLKPFYLSNIRLVRSDSALLSLEKLWFRDSLCDFARRSE